MWMRMMWRRLAGGWWRARRWAEQGRPVRWQCRQVRLLHCPPACPFTQANAPSCDRLEDLASLVYLNESSVMHTLRQRYGASLLHTYAGPSLLVLSPRGAPAVYSEKVRCPLNHCVASWIHPATTCPTFSGSAPPPPAPHWLLSTLSVDLGKRCHFKGWAQKAPPQLLTGQNGARIRISMPGLRLGIPPLPPWSERPRKMLTLGARGI